MTAALPLLGSFTATLAAAHTAATLLVCRRAGRGPLPGGRIAEWVLVLVSAGVAAGLCLQGADALGLSAVLVAAVPVAWLAVRPLTGDLHTTGRLAVAVSVAAHLLILAWCVQALVTASGSGPARVAMAAWLLTGIPRVALTLFDSYLCQERLLRQTWRRSRHAPRTGRRAGARVCVQVPCHAEPPEVVMATLDALAAQDYDDFEVLVVDNNTTDPALWVPVRDHCERLGKQFRFHHVEGLEGAKAGALNYAMEHTSPDVAIVAVIDADYQARPDFLARLTPLFDDPATGFVQVRHDYRGWWSNSYVRACYWEYRMMYATYLVARAERGSAIIAGTMCLIRSSALREAGGWAQWCSSEDSELALRIHAAGYASHYFDEPFGHGLVPETFGGYRKQRARWVFGPAQELRRHWRILLPRRWARPSALSGPQKLLHAHHGAREMVRAAHTALAMACVAVLACVLVAGGEVPWHPALACVALLLAANGLALRWCLFRRVLRCTAREAAGAVWAQCALHHITWAAVLPSWWTSHRPWRRTSKFPELPSGAAALAAVWPETSLGILWAAGAVTVAATAPPTPARIGVCAMLVFYAALAACAPVLALRADRALASTHRGPSHRLRVGQRDAGDRERQHLRR
ncbi:glycosyltransferase [Streptomyces sp. YC504]|uniref:Beta-monoglucosyldiacylglycerol synthase n=1 Tax=Streptomyces mesophilus TaxID=1775132 RepID=A0A6G4XD29_9ACTN|nr:glycosyltransferase [Streptomyces mesophilus]NGO75466.1 glycosyltransferase [Streptomyces mesophilus]